MVIPRKNVLDYRNGRVWVEKSKAPSILLILNRMDEDYVDAVRKKMDDAGLKLVVLIVESLDKSNLGWTRFGRPRPPSMVYVFNHGGDFMTYSALWPPIDANADVFQIRVWWNRRAQQLPRSILSPKGFCPSRDRPGVMRR